MHRADAVQRIREGLGFHPLEESIILRRLAEAQRDLESGKTLPQFLVNEDAPIVLEEGTRETALPTDFLREYDDGSTWSLRIARQDEGVRIPIRKVDLNSLLALGVPTTPGSPLYYVIRTQSLWFGRFADQTYTLVYSYYARARSLLSFETNAWTDSERGFDWLVGFAGQRLARNLRDQAAEADFAAMRTEGRAALLGEIIAQDDVPMYLGSAL